MLKALPMSIGGAFSFVVLVGIPGAELERAARWRDAKTRDSGRHLRDAAADGAVAAIHVLGGLNALRSLSSQGCGDVAAAGFLGVRRRVGGMCSAKARHHHPRARQSGHAHRQRRDGDPEPACGHASLHG